MSIQGFITVAELKQEAANGKIDTVIVAFADHYGRMMGKRFDIDFFLETMEDGTHACDYLLTTDMEMEPVPGYTFANWELGYGDFHLIPELHTLRRASWLRKTAIVQCQVFNEKTHAPVVVAPRTILSHQLNRLSKRGLQCMAASELEYYLFEQSYREAHQENYHDLTPAGWYLEDYHILQGSRTEKFTAAARRHLKKSGVPVENSKGEWGKGQHELNVRYAECMQMADNHLIFKQCLKEIADRIGLSVTFMAKPHTDQAGSSCHIHMSLWKDDQNMFAGEEQIGTISCSKEFKWFLGGWINYVPDMMVFYAPTINAYKRYVDGSWAPTRLAWSYDNRTAGFRVVGKGSSLRIECRIPGADCNPYLAFAASLASGMAGIKNQIEPPDIFEGDIYAAKHLPRVPYTLAEAVTHFKESAFAKEAFGEKVVDHYAHFYNTEVQSYQSSVTDWERQRYFERI